MTQDFTEDSYDPDHIADTDMVNQEDNDLSLKSSFAGASSPPNRVDGMFWHDSSGLLKHCYNNAWVTIFDLANARALLALLATNCSRSVLAGTGISGGGELNQNITLTHASHSGEVTGQTGLTIGANIINPTKCYPGTLMLAHMDETMDEISLGGTSWNNVVSFPVKCPSSATVLRLYARIKNTGGNGLGRCRINTPWASSTYGVNVGTDSYSWVDCGTATMASGSAGSVYTVNIQGYSAAYFSYIKGYRIWWE